MPFLSSLTAGFDSAVGLRAINGPRWLRGLPRYLLATFGELAALRNWPLQVTTDGELIHNGPALFASSAQHAHLCRRHAGRAACAQRRWRARPAAGGSVRAAGHAADAAAVAGRAASGAREGADPCLSRDGDWLTRAGAAGRRRRIPGRGAAHHRERACRARCGWCPTPPRYARPHVRAPLRSDARTRFPSRPTRVTSS